MIIIDNYDSFTFNLYQYIGHFNREIKVIRNDEMKVADIAALNPSHLVISPGPKYPQDAGVSIEAIKYFNGRIPILGVCLGHQGIGEAFGGKVVRAKQILHGKQSKVCLDTTCALFKGLQKELKVARYHSLILEKEALPEILEIVATDEKGEIMGIKHKEAPTFGLQFHPESILTEKGKEIIKNFLEVDRL